MQGIIWIVGVALTAFSTSLLRAADIAPPSDLPSHTPLPNLGPQLSGLDSDDYATRRMAIAGVEAMLKMPQNGCRRLGQLPHIPWQTLSFEAQTKLGALGLPVVNSATTAPRSGAVFNTKMTPGSLKEIALWIKQLASDRYLVRAAALEGLAAAVRNSAIIQQVYPSLKEAAADPTTSVDARVAIYSLLDVARYTWLTSSANGDDRPPSPQRVSRWIDKLVEAQIPSGDSANDSGLRKRTVAANCGRMGTARWTDARLECVGDQAGH